MEQYQSQLSYVKLDPEMAELKTQTILRIVATALARQVVMQLDEGQDESIAPASSILRPAKETRSGKTICLCAVSTCDTFLNATALQRLHSAAESNAVGNGTSGNGAAFCNGSIADLERPLQS